MGSALGALGVGLICASVAFSSACLLPPSPVPAHADDSSTVPTPAVVPSVSAPPTTATTPSAPLASSSAPASDSATPSKYEHEWKAPTPAACPPRDAGVTLATSSVVDFARLEGGIGDTKPTAQPGTVSNAALVVAGMRSGFHSCYQDALSKDPATAGQVRLTIYVDCDGAVWKVLGSSPNSISPETLECLFDVVRAARFDPPEGGKGATIAVPVTLVRK
jgi:hypothetical protein